MADLGHGIGFEGGKVLMGDCGQFSMGQSPTPIRNGDQLIGIMAHDQ